MKQNIYDHPDFYQSYKELRERDGNYNVLLEQPAMKQLLPDLKGKQVLDIGCGMGDFANYCIEQDASEVVGIDISANMIEEAQRRYQTAAIVFQQCAFEDFDSERKFDVIISSLALHYMIDYQAVVQKVHSLLKPDGIFLYSIEHPIVTARRGGDNWVKEADGSRKYYAIDHYQAEGKRETEWFIEGVIKYHRTFAALINGLVHHGFSIQHITEPVPDEAAIQKLPKLKHELRKPSFLVVMAKRK